MYYRYEKTTLIQLMVLQQIKAEPLMIGGFSFSSSFSNVCLPDYAIPTIKKEDKQAGLPVCRNEM